MSTQVVKPLDSTYMYD